ncbi:hypothetical protein KW783_00310 [Candidatus Parcubacteria bacterium]|nr:hypothetical protein [Candidatus Parcubacteria bacterium]
MKAILKLVLLISAVAALVVIVKPNFLAIGTPEREAVNKIASDVSDTIQKKVNFSTPLRVQSSAKGTLDRQGVFSSTNSERLKNGAAVLTENTLLDQAATIKVNDMFTRQYFEHESPTGEHAGDIALSQGYDYIIVGENLALGNFKDDQDLVTAWMNSPGHRANILNPKYKHIGIAVKQGQFEGKTTWLAVQIFGTSSTLCTKPDEVMKTIINSEKIQLDTIARELDSLKQSIDRGSKEDVNRYNELAGQYNSLAGKAKSDISRYNTSVQIFNTCIETYS